MRRVLISTKPFIYVLFPVGVTVRSAESLSSVIPLGTSTERANSKRANHGRSRLFQDAVSSVSFWLRSFSVCGWRTRSLSSVSARVQIYGTSMCGSWTGRGRLNGLPPAVVETIIQARDPSTRQTYALKWSLFATWCSSRREDPRRCMMQELRTATDFALRATKVTARSLGKAMSTMVVQERHLWLNLAEMKDVDKARFLDAPISQGGLFGDTVEGFAQQFSTVQQQTEAIQQQMPPARAGALHATGRQPRGSGQGPDCFGTSTAWSCGQCI